jgi:hypothetical protein
MTNEYIVYWRREVLYRTKVIAESEEGALDRGISLHVVSGGHEDRDSEVLRKWTLNGFVSER